MESRVVSPNSRALEVEVLHLSISVSPDVHVSVDDIVVMFHDPCMPRSSIALQ